MPEQSLGDRIRQLREQQGLSREQLNAHTKIMLKYIEALEEGRWDLLPGQVYLKPFIKNIAEVLNADYKELYALIDHTDTEETPEILDEEGVPKKRFDYRWWVVGFMVIVVAIIAFMLRPTNSSDEQSEGASGVTVINHDPVKKEKKFSNDLDIAKSIISAEDYHSLELTAVDSVWLVLLAGPDTLYTGILPPGRKIVRKSAKPIKLMMGRQNCLDITYDNIKIDREKHLKSLSIIDFSKFDFTRLAESGETGENQ